MKIGIIGVGAVGSAVAMSVAIRGVASEVVLIDRDRERAAGVATDMMYGAPLVSTSHVRQGDYADLGGAGLVIITAGVNEKAGGATDRKDPLGRLRLLKSNAAILADVVPRIVAAAPNAVILIATNPPEPLVTIAREYAGHDRIMSTSTSLDTSRFRVHLARCLDVHPDSVDAYVVGEHGTGSVFLWSSARVGGRPLSDWLTAKNLDPDTFRRKIEEDVRHANITIIQGTGASQYGIGIVAARVAEVILRDEHHVLPVGSFVPAYGTTLSLPSIVGRSGVIDVVWPQFSPEEKAALERCAERLRETTQPYLPAPKLAKASGA